jgi:hypothetical protein
MLILLSKPCAEGLAWDLLELCAQCDRRGQCKHARQVAELPDEQPILEAAE